MDKVGTYSSYVNNYGKYDAMVKSKFQRESMAAQNVEKADAASSTKQVELSEDAKNLLKELQQKYGNMDFIVGDYETEEEAAAYLARGTKEYSVLITADELEKMAADQSVKDEYTQKIEDAANELAALKSQLDESGENVTQLGIVFEKDGSTSLFASLEKISERQKEHFEETKEAKQAEKASERSGKKPYERVKKTAVTAQTAEELLEKIRSVDWSQVEEEAVPAAGGKFEVFG